MIIQQEKLTTMWKFAEKLCNKMVSVNHNSMGNANEINRKKRTNLHSFVACRVASLKIKRSMLVDQDNLIWSKLG